MRYVSRYGDTHGVMPYEHSPVCNMESRPSLYKKLGRSGPKKTAKYQARYVT
jgi:hypothetical protein